MRSIFAFFALCSVSSASGLAVDLPDPVRGWFRNPDGSCVQCSIGMCGVDQNVPAAALLLWDTEYGARVRGGSWPSRVVGYCRERGIRAFNITGSPTWAWMAWAVKTGRGAAIGAGPAHFQTLMGKRGDKWVVCNNNSPDRLDEYDDAAFRRLHLQSGPWCVILDYPPHPARPVERGWGDPQVETEELSRLGDSVMHVDGTKGADDAFLDAMATPADDSGKWFVTVIGQRGCRPCEALDRDWQKSKWLRAFAQPDDPHKSWAHFNRYELGDQSQAFRWTNLKIEATPTILIQPPRNKRFGDPSRVVFKAVYDGDDEGTAKAMSAAIRRYVRSLHRSGVEAGADPPWVVVPDDEDEHDEEEFALPRLPRRPKVNPVDLIVPPVDVSGWLGWLQTIAVTLLVVKAFGGKLPSRNRKPD